ncbi:MAG: Xaa-Pro aminopeptidase [Acidimicrobiales bacterium]|jgi:Xaa-Pro aminopeptidase|nr:Xaa-Pro aminopeptidase [Acidimicrobiales bacterium]
MDVAGRLPRLRASLAGAGADALLVTRLVNIRYLTGFTGSAGLLLVQPDDLVFVTDGRYRDQAADQLAAAGVDADIGVGLTAGRQREILAAAAAAAAAVGRLGLEALAVTWAQQREFASTWFPSAELVATEGLVEALRKEKDAGELARIAAAASIADDALASVLPQIVGGATERDVAIELDFAMRRGGASGPSFETIVAAGPNGAKPHARPSARPIGRGELVVLDFGAVVDGYCSDMTRTVCVGEPADPTAARMVEVVARSQAAGVAAVRAGARAKEVDDACRTIIAEAGWGDAFLHGTGHGVGLEIHEAPRVAASSADSLAVGHVVTVEPGVYLPEHGGVRIEDTLVVTEDGCRRLTNAPKDLVLQ